MSLSAPAFGAPWWVVVVLALAGGGIGAWLAGIVGRGTHRRLADGDQPLPDHRLGMVLGLAVVWASLTWHFGAAGHWTVLPAYLFLGALGAGLCSIDLDVHRLPDVLVLPSIPVAFVLLALASWGAGAWGSLLRAVIAAAALFVAYFVLAVVSPGGGGLGFGDVKLAAVLGLYLGWVGWSVVFTGVMAAFLVGGIAAVVLLLARRATRQSHIAFGPAMLVGAWLALLVDVQVLTS